MWLKRCQMLGPAPSAADVFATGDRKEYAQRALKAAQDLQREFGTLGEQWKKDFGLPAAISAAVHLGEAVFGMAGPIAHQQFVAFGDCVSVTERLVHREIGRAHV